MSDRLVVVGDALLDRDVEGSAERLSPETPVPVLDEADAHVRPGGAALAAALAAADDRPVTLVAGIGADAAGDELRGLLADAGVELVDMGLDGPTPEKIRLRAGGRTLLRHDRNCLRRAALCEPGPAVRALAGAAAILVADYGRGTTSNGGLRRALASAARHTPTVWDPHPRGREPVAGTALATPNQSEAAALVPEVRGDGMRAVAARGWALAERWGCGGVVVTLGAHGALLVEGAGAPRAYPAAPAHADPCGAGDRFSSAAAAALADGAAAAEAVAAAVHAASAFVAAGGACSLPHADHPPRGPAWDRAAEVAGRVRARGGTVVATGGCFDLLHPGHVATLEAARALGDCLVVLVNSDDSVRRLKGPGRPLVDQNDRARVLRALTCVDEVCMFAEDTPVEALRRLRPDVFAKGGDYRGSAIPEEAAMHEWGGQVVLLPTLAGRSTTSLIERAGMRRGR